MKQGLQNFVVEQNKNNVLVYKTMKQGLKNCL